LTVHTSANAGPGRFGLPRYINASRMTLQPALAAVNGTLYLAWSNSTSPFFGDPAGNSTILFIRSADGGNTWSSPTQVNPSGDDIHMVLPAIAADNHANGSWDQQIHEPSSHEYSACRCSYLRRDQLRSPRSPFATLLANTTLPPTGPCTPPGATRGARSQSRSMPSIPSPARAIRKKTFSSRR
jgi:hypothetical protein